jgi:hypothetical protein
MRLAMPDMDLLTFPEMADAVETVIAAAPNVLWLADGDTAMATRSPCRRRLLLWTGLQTHRLHIVGYPFLRNLYWSQVRLRSKFYAVRIFYLGIVKQTPLSQCPLLSPYVSARPTTSTSNATGKVIGSPATATASPAAPF